MKRKARKVNSPYRKQPRRDRALFGYDSLTLDEQQALFDSKHGIPARDGGVGGLPMIDQPPLKEHKINSNSPTIPLNINFNDRTRIAAEKRASIDASRLERQLSGRSGGADAFFHPPPRWSLSHLREWLSSRTSPDWQDTNSETWTAPDCTIGVFRDNRSGEVKSFLPCHLWTCPACAEKNKMKLIKGVNKSFADQRCFFLTLTVNPHKFDDKEITKAMNRLKASLRKYGYFIPSKGHIYFWVKEFTPPSHEYRDGHGTIRRTVGHVRHIHILTNFFIPQRIDYSTPKLGLRRSVDLSDLWRKATHGSSTQIDMTADTELHGAIRASYMTKYITKSCSGEQLEHDFQKYERRFGKSVGLFVFRPRGRGTCFLQFLKPGKFTPLELFLQAKARSSAG